MSEQESTRYTKDERLALYDTILEARFRRKATWDEIAEETGIARSTIRRWRDSEEFQLAEARWRRTLREEARSDVALIGRDMVGVVQDLAYNARSEFVRMTSAFKLIDIFGIADEVEEIRNDQQSELLKFLQQQELQKQERNRLRELGQDLDNVIEAEVRPGGLLPEPVAALGQGRVAEKMAEEDDEL